MRPGEVIERVQRIREIAGDYESAHVEEDRLHQEVLEAIRDGASEPEELARQALKTTEIAFERWYA